MLRMFRGTLAATALVLTATAIAAHADEAALLLCRIRVPPFTVQMEVLACQASAGANLVCPTEGTPCADALAAVLSQPGFKLKEQVSIGSENTLYTIVNPRASH
ncbi:MAG: hypothetical protein ACRELZ_06490 [Candidatus Rokuibacteriota bacterium]